MWLNNFRNGVKKGFLNRDRHFIRRWPVDPKVVFYGPPNAFMDELSQRYVKIKGVFKYTDNIIRK